MREKMYVGNSRPTERECMCVHVDLFYWTVDMKSAPMLFSSLLDLQLGTVPKVPGVSYLNICKASATNHTSPFVTTQMLYQPSVSHAELL